MPRADAPTRLRTHHRDREQVGCITETLVTFTSDHSENLDDYGTDVR